MDISYDQQNGVGVVTFSGVLTGEAAQSARTSFDSWYRDRQGPDVVLDMGDVAFMDSTGLGVLLTALKRVRDRGGRLRVCRVQEKPRMVIEITRSYKVLELRDDVGEAVAELHSA